MKKIILTGGGSAGHVTPNLARVPGLKERGYEIKYVGSVDGIEKQIRRKQEKLESLQGLGGVFRLKLKAALMNEITGLLEERRKQQELLDGTVTKAGYWNVASFLKAYEKEEA